MEENKELIVEDSENIVKLRNAFRDVNVKGKFYELLGKRSGQFMTAVTTAVQNNKLLEKADINSIIMGAAISASLDLSISPSIGEAALVPYTDSTTHKVNAQFQIMAKGLVSLCIRTNLFEDITNELVYEGQLIRKDKFKGIYEFDENAKVSDKVIGVMASFKLLNGFHKTDYMTIDEVKAHAKQYSKAYRSNAKIWKDNLNDMALKTVLRRLLSKWGLKKADYLMYDNAVISGDITRLDEAKPNYVDSTIVQDNNNQQGEFQEAVVVNDVDNEPQKEKQASITKPTPPAVNNASPKVSEAKTQSQILEKKNQNLEF